MSDVLVNDMFARIMESIQENTEHLQEHLQAIDERLSAVGRSRGSNRSRVGTIVDTSPHSVAHSVISWDPASTTDSPMSCDPSPSPATNHHIGSIRSQDSLHPPHSRPSPAPPLNNVGRSASRETTAAGLRPTEWSIQQRGVVGIYPG
jgi:hypothetical protein